MYLRADDGAHGTELWRSDGSEGGTTMVKDIYPGTNSSDVANLSNIGTTLFFEANDGTHGGELWRSDGSEGGTKMVKDIDPGAGSSFPAELTNLGGELYFAADDGTHGVQLWRSDGTEGGTSMVVQLNPTGPGLDGNGNTPMTIYNGRLYFRASDGSTAHGQELWSSDGTAAGTSMVQDIFPGTGSSQPGDFTISNGLLFFSADDGTSGRQIWRFPAPAVPATPPPTGASPFP